jgi:hypothetical protein
MAPYAAWLLLMGAWPISVRGQVLMQKRQLKRCSTQRWCTLLTFIATRARAAAGRCRRPKHANPRSFTRRSGHLSKNGLRASKRLLEVLPGCVAAHGTEHGHLSAVTMGVELDQQVAAMATAMLVVDL